MDVLRFLFDRGTASLRPIGFYRKLRTSHPKSLTELSRETIYGHPCVKYRVTFAEEGEDERKEAWGLDETSGGQALLWKATDLGGLPIKYEGRNGGGYEILAFKELKPAKPDAKLFDPPTSYTRFDSLELLYKAKVKLQSNK